jgi:hypothetical protein
MKAIIEASEGLHIIRIYKNRGSLSDVFVVEEIELKEDSECEISKEQNKRQIVEVV